MELFLEFAAQQWLLIAALAAVIALLVAHEGRKAGPSLSPQQAINMVNSEAGVFIDLRDARAYQQGHIVDSVHIPMAKLKDRSDELQPYRDKPVILVCNMGQQAGAASRQLKEAGFSKVYKMAGGMMEWNSLQLPTISK